MMQPFKVTVWVGTPVCLNWPWIHLDGLTAHLKYERSLGREFRYLPSKTVVSQPNHDRPLFRKTNGVRHASVSVFVPDTERYTVPMFKRFEPDSFPRRGPQKVNIGSGHYRNYMLRSVVVPCERVEFYANGDMDYCAELLSGLMWLGDDGRVGWGKVIGIDLEPMDDDLSLTAHGVAMRPIPVSACRSHGDDVARIAWRAPYWARESVDLCAVPGCEVVLA
ncbi:MAG: hypothetical protein WC977_09665 [Anaerovoracaceae bacterium]|jgi:CRISPR type IV-associated protein Csf3